MTRSDEYRLIDVETEARSSTLPVKLCQDQGGDTYALIPVDAWTTAERLLVKATEVLADHDTLYYLLTELAPLSDAQRLTIIANLIRQHQENLNPAAQSPTVLSA